MSAVAALPLHAANTNRLFGDCNRSNFEAVQRAMRTARDWSGINRRFERTDARAFHAGYSWF
jgi:hypothetical protein